MTAGIAALPQVALTGVLSPPESKKRVLLLDSSQTKSDLRADVMRKLGIEVDCAADVLEARCWWKADLYHLVLINSEMENGIRDEFCLEMRSAHPPQRVAFFVGQPDYLAAAPPPGLEPGHADANIPQPPLHGEGLAAERASSQRWGIMEACRKIFSVRAASEARSRAVREAPRPSRWAEAVELHSVALPALLVTQPSTNAFAAALSKERDPLL